VSDTDSLGYPKHYFLRKVLFWLGIPVVLFCAFLAFFWWITRPSFDEVQIAKSPTSEYVARLFEINGGATTSFLYEVHIAPSGRANGVKVAELYGAVRNASAYGANLRWENEGTLLIEYLDAKDIAIENSRVQIGSRVITIKLRQGVTDSNAPSGGMHYNLRKSAIVP
jgi:hypothetical protein